MANFFARTLLTWHHDNPRPLPWSVSIPDPYHIWISEVIMQQTRVDQGTDYYLRFIKQFPTVASLASASVDEVMRLWQGLGYYSRARNLHKAAKHILENLSGRFPDQYPDLLALPGIGPYSAAAISSFAFGHRHVVVDGNVKRIIARFSGVTTSIDDAKTHQQIQDIAFNFMKDVSPGLFNQAIMNFGAMVCLPKNPLCNICPLASGCFAFQHSLVNTLPVRTKKKPVRNRFFHFVLVEYKHLYLMHRRENNDIWKGLYCLPHLETRSFRSPGRVTMVSFIASIIGKRQTILQPEGVVIYKQLLSHQLIHGRFYTFKINSSPARLHPDFKWVDDDELETIGKPKMIVQYFLDR